MLQPSCGVDQFLAPSFRPPLRCLPTFFDFGLALVGCTTLGSGDDDNDGDRSRFTFPVAFVELPVGEAEDDDEDKDDEDTEDDDEESEDDDSSRTRSDWCVRCLRVVVAAPPEAPSPRRAPAASSLAPRC